MFSSFTGSLAYGRRQGAGGLTLLLDAASYPGSGTTWSDESGNGNDATLVNTPTYSSSYGGYFAFNPASSEYATVSGTPLNPNSYTKSVWCMFDASTDNNLISSSTGGHFMFTGGTNKLYCGHSNWTGFPTTYPSTANISNGVWYNFTLTFSTSAGMALYINGVLDSTYTAQKTAPAGGGVNLAAYSAGGNLLNGKIAKVSTYNRVLSAREVLQNYNADKARFQDSIVTTGLLVHLDANNSSSYSGSGNTWVDIQGNNDATIYGPTYSANNGGVFVFDGANDYIQIADSTDLRANTTNVRTVQTWVKIKSYVDADGIWGKQYGAPSYDGYSLAIKTNNILRLQMNGGAVNGGYNSSNNAFTSNTWFLVTAVVRFGGNTNQSLVYVNDNTTPVVSANNAETSIPNINAPFIFGRDVQEGTDYADIDVGALYVYDTALSTTQIAQNYNATKSRYGL